jgi:mannose-6-phosphate isomerase-like protein (cupin superfamily)
MGEYTIANLKEDVEDQAPGHGLAPNLEGRFARQTLELEQSGLSYQRLAPGFRVPFGHRHERQEEIYVVVGGGGRVKLDDEVRDVKAWDAVRVPPGTWRAFEAGPDGIELLAFGARPGMDKDASDGNVDPAWWTD